MMSVRVQNEMFKTLNQKMFSGNVPIKRVYAGSKLVYPAEEEETTGLLKVRRLEYELFGDYETNVYYGRSTSGYDITECKGFWWLKVDVTFLVDVYVEEVPWSGYYADMVGSNIDGYAWAYVTNYASGYLVRIVPVDKTKNDIPCVGIMEGYNDYSEWPQYWNGSGRYVHTRDVDHSNYYNYRTGFYHTVSTNNTTFTSDERTSYITYINNYRRRYSDYTFASSGTPADYILRGFYTNMKGSHNNPILYSLRVDTSNIQKQAPSGVLFFIGDTDAQDEPPLSAPSGKVTGWNQLLNKGEYAGFEVYGGDQKYSWEEDSYRSGFYNVLKPQVFKT